MTTNFEKALQQCKGEYQRNLVRGTESVGGSTLRGASKKYAAGYAYSANSLLKRLCLANIPYRIQYGQKGGLYTAKLVILEGENENESTVS